MVSSSRSSDNHFILVDTSATRRQQALQILCGASVYSFFQVYHSVTPGERGMLPIAPLRDGETEAWSDAPGESHKAETTESADRKLSALAPLPVPVTPQSSQRGLWSWTPGWVYKGPARSRGVIPHGCPQKPHD